MKLTTHLAFLLLMSLVLMLLLFATQDTISVETWELYAKYLICAKQNEIIWACCVPKQLIFGKLMTNVFDMVLFLNLPTNGFDVIWICTNRTTKANLFCSDWASELNGRKEKNKNKILLNHCEHSSAYRQTQPRISTQSGPIYDHEPNILLRCTKSEIDRLLGKKTPSASTLLSWQSIFNKVKYANWIPGNRAKALLLKHGLI